MAFSHSLQLFSFSPSMLRSQLQIYSGEKKKKKRSRRCSQIGIITKVIFLQRTGQVLSRVENFNIPFFNLKRVNPSKKGKGGKQIK